ncbi:hypothetical protein TL16_g04992 [Triparma laevis f. inornata]|uniref:CHAT domain-containing protein n=1 Tax=Triparma laevis f. inornata TaxID=1714386 RepID=A0A9W7AAW7_9STRA|nr:hypothetical protein TL16_g04992 [Triparma laevis f. inornata]
MASQPLFKIQNDAHGNRSMVSMDVLDTQKELSIIKKAAMAVCQTQSPLPFDSPPLPPSRGTSSSSTSTTSKPKYYSSIHLESQTGSISSFRTLLTLTGAVIIHYGGHGDSVGNLLFESSDGDGQAAPVKPETLRRVFSAGRGEKSHSDEEDDSDSDSNASTTSFSSQKSSSSSISSSSNLATLSPLPNLYQSTKLAFVSACHSLHAGHAFVNAGVPHVIATTSQIRDESVIEFELQFYQALFTGKSIQEAFDVAVNALGAVGQERQVESDGEKFILLGGGDHSREYFFHHSTRLSSVQLTSSPVTFELGLPVGVSLRLFIGRGFDMNICLKAFKDNKRLMTVQGERGVGKTSLAIRAVRYSCERRSHFARVNYVSFPEIGDFLRLQEERSRNRNRNGEISVKNLCKGIYAQLEQNDADSSMSGSASSMLSPPETNFSTQMLYSYLTSTDVNPTLPSQPPPNGSSSPMQSLLHSSSTMSLEDSRVLIILDGVDSFISNDKYSKATITLLNDLLKIPSVSIMATSRVKLLPLINEKVMNREERSDELRMC